MPRRLDGDDSGPAEPEQPTPYADGAPSVEQSGFGWPVPIPFGEKQPPPTGSTGKSGSVTHADVKAWTLSNDGDNIAVVLNHGVVGIDVDDYDGKGGGTTAIVNLAPTSDERFPPIPKPPQRPGSVQENPKRFDS